MCEHTEVRIYTDDDPDHSWAYCSYCEADLSHQWWDQNLRDEFTLVPNTLGNVQVFTLRRNV